MASTAVLEISMVISQVIKILFWFEVHLLILIHNWSFNWGMERFAASCSHHSLLYHSIIFSCLPDTFESDWVACGEIFGKFSVRWSYTPILDSSNSKLFRSMTCIVTRIWTHSDWQNFTKQRQMLCCVVAFIVSTQKIVSRAAVQPGFFGIEPYDTLTSGIQYIFVIVFLIFCSSL